MEPLLYRICPAQSRLAVLGVACILWATRRKWREHWINTGDDRFLGLNTESFHLVAPLLIWLIMFGIVGMLLDMMARKA